MNLDFHVRTVNQEIINIAKSIRGNLRKISNQTKPLTKENQTRHLTKVNQSEPMIIRLTKKVPNQVSVKTRPYA